MREAQVEWAMQGVALGLTLALSVWVALSPAPNPPPTLEAPKHAEVALSVVEEPPPSATPPPPPVEEPPPPPAPPQVAPSLLPPPPPPRPRRIMHPKVRPMPHPAVPSEPLPPTQSVPSQVQSRAEQHAPESHSAESAYVSRLHAIVRANTRPPESAAYRMNPTSGDVVVGFTLTRGGALANVHVLRSSGHSAIDSQGVLIVSSGHYPAMPEDVFPGQAALAFEATVSIAGGGTGGDNL